MRRPRSASCFGLLFGLCALAVGAWAAGECGGFEGGAGIGGEQAGLRAGHHANGSPGRGKLQALRCGLQARVGQQRQALPVLQSAPESGNPVKAAPAELKRRVNAAIKM